MYQADGYVSDILALAQKGRLDLRSTFAGLTVDPISTALSKQHNNSLCCIDKPVNLFLLLISILFCFCMNG